MKNEWKKVCMLALLCMVVAVGSPHAPHAQTEQAPPPAAQITPDPWPKLREIAGVKYTLYQPQVDKWDGYNFEAHAAVGVVAAGSKDQIFGAVEMTAVTDVAKVSRTVHFRDVKIVKAVFPTAPDKSAVYQRALQTMASNGPSTMSLDRLEISLAINGEEKKARAVPVKNDPPRIVFTHSAAILVPIDGAPVWRVQSGTRVERAINTRAFVALDDSTGRFYVHIFDGFVEAPAITGPWTATRSVPPAVTALEARLAQQNVIDPMTGPSDPKTKQKASLKNGVPEVIVTTTPTELIVTEGAPDWVPIEGTMLLYVKNTTGNVFKNLNDQQNYVLVTGRWFHAPELSGPWRYIAGTELPPDFTRIPDDSPKENVKAAVPYTTQADEALIANGIPQTATIDRAKAKFTPQIDGGSPDMRPIPDTGLSYVFNSPTPIIMVSADAWYAVQNGVWFSATWALGPWVVATSVPAVLYSIPASSPLHYVTYVQVYNATPQYVVVGYTPGYLGTVVAPGGVVVYGTGYTYTPYIGASVWYPPPVTYGYAANPYWTPWTGWGMGFGMGMALGVAIGHSSCCWGYCPAPYWGVHYSYGSYGGAYWAHGGGAVWGSSGWAATSGNVYHQWGATGAVTRTSGGYNAWTGNAWSTQVGHSYNSMTGRISAGERGSVQNVYTGNYAYGGRGATYNPTTGVAARGGTATVGNAYTGTQSTAKWGQATGPHGQSTGFASSDGNVYADHDGNVYRNTGSSWQTYNNGSWNNTTDENKTQSLNAEQNGRWAGDQRSAGSSWGSSSWGGGFNRSGGDSWGGSSSGWDRGSGGWDSGGSGGGGIGGGSGSFGGGDRSWGGGSFGGGRSWGGGFRR
jgi:hypothetical protein